MDAATHEKLEADLLAVRNARRNIAEIHQKVERRLASKPGTTLART